MDRLSPEVLHIILSFLNYNDRFNLMLVNKFWLYLIEKIKFDKLVIFEHMHLFIDQFKLKKGSWEYNDTLTVDSIEKLFKNKSFLNSSRHIKTLVIIANDHVSKSKKFKINFNFVNLNYLELHNLTYENIDNFFSKSIECFYSNVPCSFKSINYKLPSLKKLSFIHSQDILDLFLPKYYCNIKNFKTENYLDSKCISRIALSCPLLEKINCKLNELDLLYSIVESLPNLKQIKFYSSDYSDINEDDKYKLKNFIKNHENIKIYYAGFLLTQFNMNLFLEFIKVKRYHNWSLLDCERLIFLKKIENNLDDINIIKRHLKMINSIRFLKNYDVDFKIISKLTNVTKLLVMKCNSKSFTILIENLKKLQNLSISSCTFDQKFYENIPICCKELIFLSINDCSLKNVIFISKLKNLQSLTIILKAKINYEIFIKILGANKYLHKLKINLENNLTKKNLIEEISTNELIYNRVVNHPKIKYEYIITESFYDTKSTVLNSHKINLINQEQSKMK